MRACLFIGTQSDGIWFQSAADQKWWHFTTREGLGADDITALCIDLNGRLWAGHGRDGLSVGNGKSWRHFPAHSAPFGAHVNALTATKTGEIWVAGEANLAVFRWPKSMASAQHAARNADAANQRFNRQRRQRDFRRHANRRRMGGARRQA